MRPKANSKWSPGILATACFVTVPIGKGYDEIKQAVAHAVKKKKKEKVARKKPTAVVYRI